MRTLIILLMFLLPATGSLAANLWTHSLYYENDLFIGTDSDYTNGMKYSVISPDLSPDAPLNTSAAIPRSALDFIHQLPLIKNAPPETGHKFEIAIGQNMYTPKDISRSDLIEDDRPYAGYSYLALDYHRKSDDLEQGWSQMDTAEIQFGIVGPYSLAEDAQKFIHRIRDLQRPNGWDNQLETEPGLTLVFERKWLYHPTSARRFCLDAITHSGVALGNIMTYANLGLEVRAGWNIPRTFSVSRIRPAGSTWSEDDKGFSVYLFGAVDGRAVLRDIFLDGNSFRDSHSVDKRPLVADLSCGLVTRYRNLSLHLSFTERTREFKGQEKTHGFGSMALGYAF